MPKFTCFFVPGFLGSELTTKNAFGRDNVFWYAKDRIYFYNGISGMELPVSGEEAPSNMRNLHPYYPMGSYYGMLISYLRQKGWTVVYAKGDWRRSLVEDATRLADMIEAVTPAESVRILCHSRGGLVARMAIKILNDRGHFNLVYRVVTVGTPHEGSLQPLMYLAGYADLLVTLGSWGLLSQASIARFLGTTWIPFVLRSWPGLLELLPKPGNHWMDADLTALLYTDTKWTAVKYPPPPGYLDAAQAVLNSIPARQTGIDWIDVAGVGLETADGMVSGLPLNDPKCILTGVSGDGTVPLGSAHTSGVRLITVPCSHDMLVCDGRLFPYLDKALAGGLSADVEISGPVLTS